MSHLGLLLDLDDGSRLTDVALHPVDDHPAFADATRGLGPQGTVYVHVLTPPTRHDPASLAGALAAFLPSPLATISGFRPDGRTWIATAQLGPHDIEELNAGPAADAALRRALGLTGIGVGRFAGLALPTHMLTAAFDAHGDISGWSTPELFIGLLVELTNTRLDDIVDRVNTGAREGWSRRDLLEHQLAEWSARISRSE
ncbi:hypothetical protein ACT3SQ_16210 [Brachybacterium sp. AOP42-C2-15]|uniref:hypothetical protein n=1 Tax=Brachybacterium sp. AOP42-C2-15 TaxID=3457670 RepID=UPI004033F86B